MVSTAQTQESIVTSLPALPSCTPHLLDYFRWHVHFEDFEKISGHKISADALRAFETMTDKKVADLRAFYGIPDNCLPHEDDLWLEASGPDVQFWTLDTWDQSAYSFCLREHSEPTRAKSLLELGFLKRRFVAYPGRYLLEPVSTTVYFDRLGNQFLIVEDDNRGKYVDAQGNVHYAADEGYTVMRRQYLYCIEAINKALWALIGQSPPAPLKRWRSLQKKKSAEETTKSTFGTQNDSSQTSADQGPCDDEIKQGNSSNLLFANNVNTEQQSLSLDFNENNQGIVELHNNSAILQAPWSAETYYALIGHHLVVPDPDAIGEEQWLRDWELPRQWLFAATSDLDCARAWEEIELRTCAMLSTLGGPTWHARETSTPFTPENLTPRHVVGWDKKTGELNGRNWRSTGKALDAERWADYEHIDYRGPSLFADDPAHSSSAQSAHSEQSYAQGYAPQSAHADEQPTQPLSSVEQTEHVVEVVAQVDEHVDDQVSTVSSEQSLSGEETAQSDEQSMATSQAAYGMDVETACIVDALIRRDHPDITIGCYPVSADLFVLGIEVALDTWYDIVSLAAWNRQSPQTQRAIDKAERYARQREAMDGNGGHDSQGPPGQGEVSEEGGDA